MGRPLTSPSVTSICNIFHVHKYTDSGTCKERICLFCSINLGEWLDISQWLHHSHFQLLQ